jgi:hypothetical protein
MVTKLRSIQYNHKAVGKTVHQTIKNSRHQETSAAGIRADRDASFRSLINRRRLSSASSPLRHSLIRIVRGTCTVFKHA